MRRRLLTIFAVLALGVTPVALAACGGDDDDSGDDTAATTESTETTTSASGGGEGGTVEISADPSGELAYEQDSAEASAGSVTIAFTNDSSVPHDVKIEGPDGDLGGTDEVSGGSTEATVDLEAGEYTFYCSVDGHRDLGMEGTLTVN